MCQAAEGNEDVSSGLSLDSLGLSKVSRALIFDLVCFSVQEVSWGPYELLSKILDNPTGIDGIEGL